MMAVVSNVKSCFRRRAALPIRRSVMVERSRLPPQRYPPKDYLEHPGECAMTQSIQCLLYKICNYAIY